MQYPIIVVVFLGIAFFILLTFVIPKFITIFESAKIDLPLPTVICNIMYHFLIDYWQLMLGVALAVFFAFRFYFRTENGRLAGDAFVLRIPLIGPLFLKSAMSRFASIFSILQSSGVGVLDAMKILSGTIGNYAISRQFDRLRSRLEQGLGISGPLRSGKYFTPMVINMVAIGEESGNLDEMLSEVSRHYDEEVGYATERLSELIGPILVVGLAAVVGFFALAIFLPMWDLTKMVK
jgi:type IV pilus assembly protein PilC